MTKQELDKELTSFRKRFGELKDEVQKAIVGYDELLTDTFVAIFSQGHVLLEGVPGLGKTFLVRILGTVFGLEPGRVQCTPDLMPADILGTQIVSEDEHGHRFLRFEKGPVFANILLVDEVNRATPKTQAALLEVMQEHAVTVGGERHALAEPFFVLATQNPMEMEGTYPLPEAQLDRFLFKLRVPFPDQEQLVEISRRTTGFHEAKVETVMPSKELLAYQEALTFVPVADPIIEYAAAMILATHGDQPGSSERVKRYVAYGASPRGMQALIRGGRVHAALDGSTAVGEEHIRRSARTALRHRVILNFEGEAEQIDIDELIDEVIAAVPTTAEKKAA
ncbi:MAG: MoxR-like ATPase [Verrucomicrobiales bacterium]|jgi:MoxR-like ATPase